MNKSILSKIMFVVFTLTFTSAFAQITIDANFDSGNIGPYSIVGNEIDFTLNTDGTSYTYWTNFIVSGVLNQEITFNINNANDVPFLSTAGRERQMVYSYNGDDWFRLENWSYSNPTYTFTQTFTQDAVQIATFFPYPFQEMHDYVDLIENSEWATQTVLGSSLLGRDIDKLTITNPSIPPGSKEIIYIIGRQHAAETCSSHMLEGLINFLVSDNIYAHGFRNKFVWYIVPMVNPDGVYVGNSRANSAGTDPNRDWNPTVTPEITIVKADISATNLSVGIDMYIDWHSQMGYTYWYNFIYNPPPGGDFFPILDDWTDFDDEKPYSTTCNPGSCTGRGWATLVEGLFNFVFEPTPHLVSWTTFSLNEEGRLTTYAIDEYFSPAYVPGPVDTRLSLVSNDFNTPSAGLGTLVLDVEAMSNDAAYPINTFKGAFQLDDVFRAQNPSVTFVSAGKLFPASDYTTSEAYRALDGRVSYEYTYNSGTRGTILTDWTKVVQVSIQYTMNTSKASALSPKEPQANAAINWYDGSPFYTVDDATDTDRAGLESDMSSSLTDIPLPVELTYFTAKATALGVQLDWGTESEKENLGFIIERKTQGTDWIELVSYKTNDALLGQGTISSASDYSFTDVLVEANTTYEYRLADIDYNGVVTYHSTRKVTVEQAPLEKVDKFTVLPAYPNPFNPSTTIRYAIPYNQDTKRALSLQIQIYDIAGKLVTTLLNSEQTPGWHSIIWNGSNQHGEQVPAGIYLSRITLGNTTKTNKLMLLK